MMTPKEAEQELLAKYYAKLARSRARVKLTIAATGERKIQLPLALTVRECWKQLFQRMSLAKCTDHVSITYYGHNKARNGYEMIGTVESKLSYKDYNRHFHNTHCPHKKLFNMAWVEDYS